ncbi:MAG: PQQ-dependent sugar dehydrogenase [Limisphaerales bacterium]
MNPKDWTVVEAYLGRYRDWNTRSVHLSQLCQIGTKYYGQIEGTNTWLTGSLGKIGPLPFGEHGAMQLNREFRYIECWHSFTNFDAILEAQKFQPLPKPPDGFTIREIVALPDYPTRIASDGQGKLLYVLCQGGDVWRVNVETREQKRIIRADDYLRKSFCQLSFCIGLVMDKEGRLYISSNHRNMRHKNYMNEVNIFRTSARSSDGDPIKPQSWFKAMVPYGSGTYNHGLGAMAFGPDGYLYVPHGARTDGGELNPDPHYAKGECKETAAMWRIDPRAAKPKMEIFAEGLRMAYGFCWNEKGEMIATENGPDADAPEELNVIERGKHYGFPYEFSNWGRWKAYPYSPNPPPGLKMERPIANLGPGGGFHGLPLYTLDPHSSPCGIAYLGSDFPDGYRGSYVVVRWGNIYDQVEDVGFDMLKVDLQKNNDGKHQAHIDTMLAPLSRPIDVHLSGRGKIYICEYSRTPYNAGFMQQMPGRILELAVKQ